MTLHLSLKHIDAYKQLMRTDKPIGSYLLLWPTGWALWIASQGPPDFLYLLIFSLGVLVMRSAGCVINDYADRDIDGHVKRTKARPLATGEVSPKEALQLFFVLISCAFLLVLFLNKQTIMLSFVGLLLAACYPFMKRYTHFPQVVLGAAFSWGIPMSAMAVQQQIPTSIWLLYFANLFWTVAYDTAYAIVDRDDDLKIGVKSTAIFFGHFDRLAILLLHFAMLLLLLGVGYLEHFGLWFYSALTVAAIFVLSLQKLIKERDRDDCFTAFKRSHWTGFIVFIGIVAEYGFA